MANEKVNLPPLYIPADQIRIQKATGERIVSMSKVALNIPSSGVMVKVKFKRSLGSGNSVFMVLGRSSSVRSAIGTNACPAVNHTSHI